jgi:hypothetical protein
MRLFVGLISGMGNHEKFYTFRILESNSQPFLSRELLRSLNKQEKPNIQNGSSSKFIDDFGTAPSGRGKLLTV